MFCEIKHPQEEGAVISDFFFEMLYVPLCLIGENGRQEDPIEQSCLQDCCNSCRICFTHSSSYCYQLLVLELFHFAV